MNHGRGITPGGLWVLFSTLVVFFPTEGARGRDTPPVRFKRIQLTSEYHGEGANLGDFNKDGVSDVVTVSVVDQLDEPFIN